MSVWLASSTAPRDICGSEPTFSSVLSVRSGGAMVVAKGTGSLGADGMSGMFSPIVVESATHGVPKGGIDQLSQGMAHRHACGAKVHQTMHYILRSSEFHYARGNFHFAVDE